MSYHKAYAELSQAAAEKAIARKAVTKAAPAGKVTTETLEDLDRTVNATYFLWRRWMAMLALAVPVVLWLGGAVFGTDGVLPNASISDYYFRPGGWVRDFFVAAMCAIGINLYFYQGYSQREDLALDLAGVCAALVGLSPTGAGDAADTSLPRLFGVPWLHQAAAVILFVTMAYVCVFESRCTVHLLQDTKAQGRYTATYRLLGVLMILVPLTVFLIGNPHDGQSRWIFFVEAFGVWIFASYWLVKSREVATILGRQASAG